MYILVNKIDFKNEKYPTLSMQQRYTVKYTEKNIKNKYKDPR